MSAIDLDSPGEHEPSAQELEESARTLESESSPPAAMLQPLIELGRGRGYVTAREIQEFQREAQEPAPELDGIYSELFEAGIEVVDHPFPPDQAEKQVPVEEDPMRLYLHEVRRLPLLAAAQEAEMARRISEARLACKILLAEEAGRQLTEDDRRPRKERMSASDRQTRVEIVREGETCWKELDGSRSRTVDQLKALAARGEDARRRLALANLRLVVSVARRYLSWGVPLLDLIQEGNMGLLRAVEKFDPARGCKFSTYAIYWIRHTITRSLTDQSRTIRIPGHMVQVLQRLSRSSRRLLQELGREPSPEELSADVGLPDDLVSAVLNSSKQPLSLDMPYGHQEGALRDYIEDHCSPDAELAASRRHLREQLHLALAALTDLERQVLTRRFGLRDGRYQTLEEIAGSLGTTRERVRQTEGKALRKLRHPTLCTRLRNFIEP